MEQVNKLFQPLKKALNRLSVNHPLLEPDQVQQYSYNILTYIAKVKHMAREEFDSLCGVIATRMQQAMPVPNPLVCCFDGDCNLN